MMPKFKFSLFTKIIVWFFLNLLLLAAILAIFFSYSFRFRPNSSFSGGFGSQIEAVTRQITNDLDGKTRTERDAVLSDYTERYKGVEFTLFDYRGAQLNGRETLLPPEISQEISRPEAVLPVFESARNSQLPKRPPPGAMPRPPSIYLQTENPKIYWFVARAMIFEKGGTEPVRVRLLAASDSFYGYGLFFNPLPWLVLTGIIFAVSVLFWFPFVRRLTNTVGQITGATEQIAEENFAVRVSEKRTDELGRLSRSINRLARRLSGFVHGQKRFLGDISHELNSPLARMNFALTILEDRIDPKNRVYVEDVKEEVELMAKLVSELLDYSKIGIKAAGIELKNIALRPLVEIVIKRETAEDFQIKIEIEENLEVSAQPELLVRALANVVRNAVIYAGHAGQIAISAEKIENDLVEITVADNGAGVPEASLDKIFDPLYRVAGDRSRQTGGTGLGLAIVKTCIEACGGKVYAENLVPHGFEIKILLKAVSLSKI